MRVIVCTPAPGMLKVIARGEVASAFASVIAWRNVPVPVSALFVTVNVAAREKGPRRKATVTAARGATPKFCVEFMLAGGKAERLNRSFDEIAVPLPAKTDS